MNVYYHDGSWMSTLFLKKFDRHFAAAFAHCLAPAPEDPEQTDTSVVSSTGGYICGIKHRRMHMRYQ